MRPCCRAQTAPAAAGRRSGTSAALMALARHPPQMPSLGRFRVYRHSASKTCVSALNGGALRPGTPSGFGPNLEHLPAFVHAGLEIDVMGPAALAGILVLDVGRSLERIRRPAHPAPGGRCFSFRDSHDVLLCASAALAILVRGSRAYRGSLRPSPVACFLAWPQPPRPCRSPARRAVASIERLLYPFGGSSRFGS